MKKKIVWLPYDFDTALGINNEGSLVFGYELEDTDHIEGGADVYNGQQSVVWNNLRDAFGDELAAMYRTLRSQGKLSYEKVEKMFEDHQGKWSEAIFNEDAYFKYILPLIDDGTGAYLEMLQGSKAEQRKWWLYNRFRYIDSKYNAGDALSDLIQLRSYAKSDVTITPYADIYPTVKFGSYLVSHRGKRGQATVCECPLTTLNDTETYIYSASQLASVGDLSGLKVGFADFSMATKLQSLKIGDADAGYTNPNLKTLTLGNNVLLKTIDVRNCPALVSTVDISGCSNIEEVYFDGTGVTGVTLPVGGVLRKLHLPSTITNLTIRNQSRITDLTVGGYTNISTLRIENSSVDSEAILRAVPAGTRVRLIGFTWEAENYAEIEALCDLLDTMRGLDEQGGNVDTAQVSGTIHTGTLTGAQIAAVRERYPYLTLTADHTSAVLTYKTFDGSSVIGSEDVLDGGNGTLTNSTARAQDAQYTYSPDGWATEPNGNKNADALKNVTADRTVYAAYSKTLRSYTVTWVKASADGGGTLQTKTYTYGTTVTAASAYTGSTPTSSQGSAEDYPFEGWNPASATVQGNTTFTAKFGSPIDVSEISDSWDTIIASIDAGTYKTKYKLGQYKPITYTDSGGVRTLNMQIVAMDSDVMTDGTKAPISFVSRELLYYTRTSYEGDNKYNTKWTDSLTRSYLGTFSINEQNVMSRILPVEKMTMNNLQSGGYSYDKTVDKYWVPSYAELLKTNNDEYQGFDYSRVFKTDESRIKYRTGTTTAQVWLLRTQATSNYQNMYTVGTNGAVVRSSKANAYFVAIGFCLGLEPPTITDTWSEILAAEQDGTYKTKYSIGDTVRIDLGTEGSHLFEIVAFDADDLADNSGKAKITWMSKNGVQNITLTQFTGGYLKNSIEPLMPSDVMQAVKSVTKLNGSQANSQETLWAPNGYEVGLNIQYDTKSGAAYSTRFSTNANRKKQYKGAAAQWWLRSNINGYYYYVNTSGVEGSTASGGAKNKLVFGFCT